MTYTLAPARLLDVRAIYHLEQEIFPKDAYPYLDLAFLLSIPWMSNHKAMTDSGYIAGFISAAGGLFDPRVAWIITIGVATAHQNQGLGRRLLSHAEQDMSRAHEMKLTVRASNAPAIHLYERMGYQMIERKPRYYRDGEDGFIMRKPLRD